MKRVLFGLAILALSATAGVDDSREMRVNVPFDFAAGKVELPAWTYIIERGSAEGVFLLRDAAYETRAVLLAGPGSAAAEPGKGTLVFHRYGDRRFLSQIQLPDRVTTRQLPMSTAERELMARRSRMEQVLVAAAHPVIQ